MRALPRNRNGYLVEGLPAKQPRLLVLRPQVERPPDTYEPMAGSRDLVRRRSTVNYRPVAGADDVSRWSPLPGAKRRREHRFVWGIRRSSERSIV